MKTLKNHTHNSSRAGFKGLSVILTVAGIILFTGIAGMGSAFAAATPDGTTPANEGVCDILQGSTAGLYGLCVAYCEAQDLDTLDKQPPSLKILANYRKKMQAGDPDMPCVHVTCPCWTDAELSSINGAACSRGTSTILIIGADLERHEAFADTNRNRCSYVDLNLNPDKVTTQSVTPAEAATCFTQVDAACSALGL